ncbi:sigma-54-dependent transcriptional regulator [Maridesulfovibrio sp.]|uniref:sigma-54-dependent transcriptional regulator n=1 Tax=Maridesulfovibrio sp. TaxID=2795000 RepID=UPI0039F0C02C
MAEILIVDDDPILCKQLELYADKLGYESDSENSFQAGVEACRTDEFDVVFLDVNLPDVNGLKGISAFKKTQSSPEVIIITSESDPDGAELALRNGAWYYLEKPLAYKTVQLILDRVIQFRKNIGRSFLDNSFDRAGIIGSSPELNSCLTSISLAAKSIGNVLITGETGTGKELIARSIHANSPRKKQPFVIIDCTNIPETLAESVLFGHEKGAFTDARQKNKGLITQADKGTVFLDEIGDLDLTLQRSLLRVIQEKKFRPVGAAREQEVDCRFVAATNRNLEKMVEAGEFRSDLYFRLATFIIQVPALKTRQGDIAKLTRHYVYKICHENQLEIKTVTPDFLEALATCDWPGNVRELINIIYVSIANAGGDSTLSPHHLPMEFKVRYIQSTLDGTPRKPLDLAEPESDGMLSSLKEFRQAELDKIEFSYIAKLVSHSSGKASKACKIAGISRSRLYQLLRKHGLELKK